MSLEPVITGDPHVFAHNEERAAINDLTEEVSVVLPEAKNAAYSAKQASLKAEADADQVELVLEQAFAAGFTTDPIDPDILVTADNGGLLDPNTASLVLTEGTELRSAIESTFDDVFAEYAPGTELGYASRLTTFTTTNVSATSGGEIPAMTLSIVGTGRPVDILFNVPAVFHSVVDTSVSVCLLVNGAFSTSYDSQLAVGFSPKNNNGPTLTLRRRILLTDGTTYNFGIRVVGGAAGTCTLVAAGYAPIELIATSR